MPDRSFTREDLEALRAYDTPTICNGLEVIAPERQALGFTTEPMVAADRTLKPIVGLARTATLRAREAPRGGPAVDRGDWYAHVEAADMPTVVAIEDLDDPPGFGAFWGEVHSAVHKALGAEGCVTNGSFRDCDMLAHGFQIVGGRIGPSHAHVHLAGFGEPVRIFGMDVAHDDVVHADFHGAVVIPADCVRRLPEAIALVARRERLILDLCASRDFSAAKLREVLQQVREIH